MWSGSANKQGFWVDGGIHAREWISPAVVLYIIKQVNITRGVSRIFKRAGSNISWFPKKRSSDFKRGWGPMV